MTGAPSDETFHMLAYAWNITAAKALAAGRKPNGRLAPAEWAGVLSLIATTSDHAAGVDLDEPLIAVPVDDAGHFPIDGWHRIRRALTEGVQHLPAIVLTAEEEHQIRIHGGDKQPHFPHHPTHRRR
ncbi:hypothetical protein [Nonomuraea sp. NPDC049758]|uniref:hypothetical protein n=1 Tax=Nonomuraea sp. NPDC049758 TaxID=3154360 RepID=UPI00342D048F